jgi:hypothetical protein
VPPNTSPSAQRVDGGKSHTGRTRHGPRLLHDAEPEVGHAKGFEHLGPFQLDVPRFVALEQANAVAEQHRHEVQAYLVEQPGFHVLPGDVRP